MLRTCAYCMTMALEKRKGRENGRSGGRLVRSRGKDLSKKDKQKKLHGKQKLHLHRAPHTSESKTSTLGLL